MKQIKLLMLLVCAAFFGSARAQVVDIAYDYVATYTWTGASSTSWSDPLNWTKTSNAPAATVLADFPGTTLANGITQVHHVVIPSNLNNRYPSLRNLGGTITISDLTIEQGATLNLGGQTLIINGFISGPGEIIAGQPNLTQTTSSLTVDRLNTVSVYTDQQLMDTRYSGLTLLETFNTGVIGDLIPGNPNGAPIYTFPTQNGYVLSAQALIGGAAGAGGLYVFRLNNQTQNPDTIALSTKTELDDLELTFAGGSPVYSISGYFSITDADFTPMYLGRPVEFNAGQVPIPQTVTNEGDIAITTLGGDVFHYTFNASGEYVGFVSNEPIVSVVVATAVFLPNVQNVGFPTVDDVKIGTRIPTGNLNFNQSANILGARAMQLQNLTYNLADAASLVDELVLNTPVEVKGRVIPQSGTLRTSPTLTPNAANLILKSNEFGTAEVASHTIAANILGRTRVERHIPLLDYNSGLPRNKQWRFLGLPYSNPTPVSDISGIRYSLTTPTMMQFLEFANNNSTYGSTSGTRNSGYDPFVAPGNTIGAGSGFAAWIYDENGGSAISGTLGASQTLSTAGQLQESGNPVTQTLSHLIFGSRIASDIGWNLISNPFASAINWNHASVVKTQVDNTIYRWDPQTGSWTTYNGITGTGGSDNIIESGASFFVKANASLPLTPNISFGQASKVINGVGGLNQFGKADSRLNIAQVKVDSRDLGVTGLRLKAMASNSKLVGDAFLGLHTNDASAGFDSKYDAYYMGASSGASIAINSNNDFKYAMQFDKPIVENGKEKRYYPLTVAVPVAGKTKLEMDVEGTWNSLNKVYLIDNKEGKTIPLSGNKLSYEFTMAKTEESDRFVLAINHVNVAEKSGITATDVRVMNNPVRADVIDAIIAHPTAKAKSYSVVNASGATVNKGSVEDNNSVQHRLGFGKSNANGVMYLRVDFENGDSKTVKFIKL